jgi:taurine dioxygenase
VAIVTTRSFSHAIAMPLDSARQSFAIHPFTGAPLGAEVIGLDLSLPLATSDLARLHRAHLDYHVLVFRDQHITPAQQVDFSRHFGALQIHVLRNFQLPEQPEVLVISNIQQDGKPLGLGDAGHFWHSDLSYKETPSLGSMLHAQELPAEGGDTLFANQHTAWDALPDDLKREVEGLQAEHWYLARYEELRQRNPYRPQLTQAQIDEVRPVSHPVVRPHPHTGRRALFVSEHFTTRILGVSAQRSRELLDLLFDYGTRAEHVYRHQWQPHDMVFWDNRSLMHLAAGCPDHLRRKLYRTTIEGDVPF